MRLASVALLLAALVVPASSGAFDLACGDSPVSAEGWTPADAEQVCSAVQQTLEWLRTLGLPLAERVLARPLDVQGFPAGEPPIGRYDPQANEIQILPFAAAVRAAVEKRPLPMIWLSAGPCRVHLHGSSEVSCGPACSGSTWT